MLRETEFDPELLEFEITESALIHDEEGTLRVLQGYLISPPVSGREFGELLARHNRGQQP